MAVFRRSRPARPTAPAEPSSNWAWAAVGLAGGLLGGLLLFAPATWLAWGVWQATSGQVVLAEPRGTVWNGSARLVGWFASVIRHVQSGYIYHYAFSMIIGILLLLTLAYTR